MRTNGRKRAWGTPACITAALAVLFVIYITRRTTAPADRALVPNSMKEVGKDSSSPATAAKTTSSAAGAAASKQKLTAAGAKSATHQQLPSITVACVSDLHNLFTKAELRIEVPPGDLLLYAGDVEYTNPTDGLLFGAWLARQPHKHKVVTFGNMDSFGPKQDPPTIPGAIVAVDRIVEVAGYRILGSPWTPKYFGAYQLLDDAHAKAHWARLLPPDAHVDIILTHGPPYGFADSARGKHAGDRALLAAVQALKRPPLLWVTGHIHEAYGTYRVPHPAVPGGVLLVGAANFYLSRPEHARTAQPRAVRLPEAELLRPAAPS